MSTQSSSESESGSRECSRKRRPRGSLHSHEWDEVATHHLVMLTQRHRRPGVRKCINWALVTSEWQKAVSEGKVPRMDTLDLKARIQVLTRAGSLPKVQEDVDLESLFQPTPEPEQEDTLNEIPLEELKREESNTSLERFTQLFNSEYSKARANVERKPVKRVSRRILPIWLQWSSDLIAKKYTDPKLKCDEKLITLNSAVYAAARAIEIITTRIPKAIKTRSKNIVDSLTSKACKLRKELGHITQEIDRRRDGRKPTPNQIRIVRLLRRAHMNSTFDLQQGYVDRRDKLARINQNLQVRKDELERRKTRREPVKRTFAQETGKASGITADSIRDYWASIVGKSVPFVETNDLKEWRHATASYVDPLWDLEADMALVVKRAKSWKAPGPDGIPSFWWKNIKAAKEGLLDTIRDSLSGTSKFPRWFKSGRIVLLPKGGDPSDPGNYRPIACLNTAYKLLTSLLTERFKGRVMTNIPSEQLALKPGLWGCTHAHAIDQSVTTHICQGSKGKRSVHVGWVDYSKAFDSIPHKAILYCLKAIGADPVAIRVYEDLMQDWNVKYEIRTDEGSEKSRPMKVKCGVLQGDTLSPMMFCLAIAPVSFFLTRHTPGWKGPGPGGRKLTHLYYMDDLKIYCDNAVDLKVAFDGVKRVSEQLNLKMNPKKCATAVVATERSSSRGVDGIPYLGANDFYKYLGIEQGSKGSSGIMFDRMKANVLERITKIWQSKLTFHQMVQATNMCAMPILRYGYVNCFAASSMTFAAIKARAAELDGKIAEILCEARARFSKCSRDRLYVDRSRGGYGLTSVVDLLEDSVVYAYCYLRCNADLDSAYRVLYAATRRSKRTVISDMDKIIKCYEGIELEVKQVPPLRIPIKVAKRENNQSVAVGDFYQPTKAAQKIVQLLRDARQTAYTEKWHMGKFAGRVAVCKDLDVERSFLWMDKGLLNSRAVRDAIAVQEGQLFTRSHPASKSSDKNCRKCGETLETIEHVVAGCRKYRTTIMIERHDMVARNIHHLLCVRNGIKPPRWSQRIEKLMENGDKSVAIYWNTQFNEAKVTSNVPDIVIHNKKDKTILIVEVGVSWYARLNVQEVIKYEKYARNGNSEYTDPVPYPLGPNLAAELAKLHNVSVTVLPVVIGTCGEVTEKLKESLAGLGLNDNESIELTAKLQRSAVIGTGWVLRAHLSS